MTRIRLPDLGPANEQTLAGAYDAASTLSDDIDTDDDEISVGRDDVEALIEGFNLVVTLLKELTYR